MIVWAQPSNIPNAGMKFSNVIDLYTLQDKWTLPQVSILAFGNNIVSGRMSICLYLNNKCCIASPKGERDFLQSLYIYERITSRYKYSKYCIIQWAFLYHIYEIPSIFLYQLALNSLDPNPKFSQKSYNCHIFLVHTLELLVIITQTELCKW